MGSVSNDCRILRPFFWLGRYSSVKIVIWKREKWLIIYCIKYHLFNIASIFNTDYLSSLDNDITDRAMFLMCMPREQRRMTYPVLRNVIILESAGLTFRNQSGCLWWAARYISTNVRASNWLNLVVWRNLSRYHVSISINILFLHYKNHFLWHNYISTYNHKMITYSAQVIISRIPHPHYSFLISIQGDFDEWTNLYIIIPDIYWLESHF